VLKGGDFPCFRHISSIDSFAFSLDGFNTISQRHLQGVRAYHAVETANEQLTSETPLTQVMASLPQPDDSCFLSPNIRLRPENPTVSMPNSKTSLVTGINRVAWRIGLKRCTLHRQRSFVLQLMAASPLARRFNRGKSWLGAENEQLLTLNGLRFIFKRGGLHKARKKGKVML